MPSSGIQNTHTRKKKKRKEKNKRGEERGGVGRVEEGRVEERREEERSKMPIMEKKIPNEAPNPLVKGKPCLSLLAGRTGSAKDCT